MPRLDPHADESLTIRVAHRDDGCVLSLSGELDLSGVDRLRRELEQAEASDARSIVVDLSALEFLDSSGLNELLAAQQRASTDGDRLALQRGPAPIQRVFEISGVLDRFRFVD
jgi:anti-anti-sigma factor